MPRPRIEGFEEKVVQGFIDRGIFKNQKEVITAAIRLLAEHHIALSSKDDVQFTDDTYLNQLASGGEEINAAVGHMVSRSKAR
jgi:Arc/MetJ-type ribon-helix-helix transcriptional regulator